ncbi:MAG TPA: glycosyltransferase [Verrucomicrobiae bacterium]|jgi:glycosyltransferase involved in cell wall biosynthesis
MKILVSALACNPQWGSESHVGWAAVQCLARDHELWVLTSPRNRSYWEETRAAGQVGDNVHFIYAGRFKPWHANRLAAHLQGWREYVDFTKQVLPVARELHDKVRFDLAHHLTLVSWRVPCRLWQLGIPLVFGPVGGNESFPSRFLPALSPVAGAFELARRFSNTKSRFSPEVRACIRNAAHVFAANAETESLMVRLRGTRAGVSRLLAYFHSSSTLTLAGSSVAEKSFDGPLRLFAGGSLDGRKGVALALQALARAKTQGVRFRYRFGGKGPEFGRIQQLVARLGLQDDVLVTEPLRGEEYARELKESHIYLLPSLRDSAGVTLAEAMLAGCVPIVADCGGPGEIVSEDCGYKVPVSSQGALIEEISRIIVQVDRNREVLRDKGLKAAKRIANHFSEENYRRLVNLVYKSVVSGK